MTDAATSTLTTYTILPDGTVKQVAAQSNGQVAMCWVARAAGNFYVTNTGSGTLTGFNIDPAGIPTVFTQVGARGGPIDLVGTSDGKFLYAQVGGAGGIDGFRINPDGTLTQVVTLTDLDGLEGIAAT